MAVALVLAAFLGAALGLIWQGSSFLLGGEEEQLTTQGVEDEGSDDEDAASSDATSDTTSDTGTSAKIPVSG
ncbi:hypothetical protein [Alteraurantiacibacter aestuarii]|uniref:Uncharacterized protein n=1 Tax=Alteraurantiacibacter aestuarii TaxID=650004 RepID=A0A844ZL41_9SPHN|nr:hypothetical protein [Alteraurantiacibacter aestuarii]MXO89151.1 hypothetical protein [Alteraurantiacibacter aestuarii]